MEGVLAGKPERPLGLLSAGGAMRKCQHQKDQPRGPVEVQVGKGVVGQQWGVCQEQQLIVGVGGGGGAVADEPVLSAEAVESPSEGG